MAEQYTLTMSNFLENALKLYPNRSHVLLADNKPYINSMIVPGQEVQLVYIHRSANSTEVSSDAIVAVQPTTSTPPNLNSAIL